MSLLKTNKTKQRVIERKMRGTYIVVNLLVAISNTKPYLILVSSSLCDDYVQGTVAGEEMVREDDEKPRFYKKDLLRILEDKNQCKEQADLLREELEEWKRCMWQDSIKQKPCKVVSIMNCRAALEAQEKVESLESEIEEVHKRVGGFYYPNEIQANALGMLPRGPNFRYIMSMYP